MTSPPIILFDGVCNLCSAAVQWIIARDRHARFRFAALQSRAGREALAAAGWHSEIPESIALIDNGAVLFRSDAAIAIARRLGLPWSLAVVGRVLPRGVRDGLYAWIASNRYRWFGKQNACMVPTPELRARFLDADDPQPTSTTESAMGDSPWSAQATSSGASGVLRGLALRAVLAFWIVTIFPFPLALIPGSSPVWEKYESILHAVVPWLGTTFLGLTITQFPMGSGDTTYNYVELLMFTVIALFVALAWTVIRRGRPVSPRTFDLVTTYVRYCLGITMLGYGWHKAMPVQMPFPGPDRLIGTIGDMSPMGLVWLFMGASTPYQIFAGVGEVIGGILVLFRRTALAGALVSAGVLANVVAINFCFDVPVKLFSSQLLLMSLFLIAPHAPRLAAVLLFNLPAQPVVLRPFPVQHRWRRWSFGIIKAAVLFSAAIQPAWENWQYLNTNGLLAPRQPWHGIYRVESFTRDGTADRALDDADRWVRVGIDSAGVGAIQRADGTSRRQRMEIDIAKSTLTISRRGEPEPMALHFAMPEPGVITLSGTFEGKPISARLRRTDDAASLLTSRGFHWINEVPFNR